MTLLLFLTACTDGKDHATPADSAGPVLAESWCDAVGAGAPSDDDARLALSRLHATVRFFRTSKDWQGVDQALADALEGETWDAESALSVYGPAVGGCALSATDTVLGPASVDTTTAGDGSEVAVVHPGTGEILVPTSAGTVALDLRGLPAGADTEAAITTALAAVLSGEVALGSVEVRRFQGFPADSGTDGIYDAGKTSVDWSISGSAISARPVVVLTDRALAPEAARAAGALRLASLGSLIGYPVWASTAESTWAAVGGSGLAFPTRTLSSADGEWPDTIEADVVTDDPVGALEAGTWETPTVAFGGEVTRQTMEGWKPGDDDPPTTLDRGSARSLLLVAHGIVDRFYPYYDVVPDDHDAALLAALDEVDALDEGDRSGVEHALGHFVHGDDDGHGFYGDWYGTDYVDSYLALQIERIDGEPVVRSSAYEDVLPGDTVVTIDGVDATDFYEESMARHSAATPGYLFEVSGREWINQASASLVVRGSDGTERSVELAGFPYEEQAQLVPWGGTLRPSGWLDDLGGDTIYLLNMNGSVTTTDSQWEDALAEASGATGLVVDMRDYPAVNHYAVAAALHAGDFDSPTFQTPTWLGPDNLSWTEEVYNKAGTGLYTGPVVLLVSNKTVSAAENFSMMLWGEDNVTVIGEQSAGTNGNITWTYLPGGYYMDFTGMHVLNPDGSELHGEGIPLDVEVSPTAADFAAGVDPELEAAVEFLQ